MNLTSFLKLWRYRKCRNCDNFTQYRGGRAKTPCCSTDCWQDMGG
jgi:hypothetical protein